MSRGLLVAGFEDLVEAPRGATGDARQSCRSGAPLICGSIVAIMLLVKEPGDVPTTGATILYRDIGDYLTRQEKLDILAEALPQDDGSAAPLDAFSWTTIQPNEHGDWINQRSGSGHLQMIT